MLTIESTLCEINPVVDLKPAKPQVSQNETTLSDAEVFRRVAEIRSGWSVDERVERRMEADRRFERLMDMLTEPSEQ
ncbi:hypothetical protein [Crateriforma conspicua]|uniref:Uncharacterized protein n=1 Tax=Crateriforma conspicua TaxID=2527996 RepID=A0A5C5Y8V0_9PLAN|nr:hypothetical protein [Crateriforma conspicua]QDV61644.1 hypothetical protein Mal65_07710 [Crateriforma conspicua]TWT72106.1 hypothetical protein Pan14r_44230 [Crateriforma conspicua]